MEEFIKKFRLFSGEEISSDLALALKERAESQVMAFCNRDDIPARLSGAILELSLYYYAKIGIEGAVSYTEGNISYGYDSGIPGEIKERLYPYVKGKVL